MPGPPPSSRPDTAGCFAGKTRPLPQRFDIATNKPVVEATIPVARSSWNSRPADGSTCSTLRQGSAGGESHWRAEGRAMGGRWAGDAVARYQLPTGSEGLRHNYYCLRAASVAATLARTNERRETDLRQGPGPLVTSCAAAAPLFDKICGIT